MSPLSMVASGHVTISWKYGNIQGQGQGQANGQATSRHWLTSG